MHILGILEEKNLVSLKFCYLTPRRIKKALILKTDKRALGTSKHPISNFLKLRVFFSVL
jgi:hypothetical protein